MRKTLAAATLTLAGLAAGPAWSQAVPGPWSNGHYTVTTDDAGLGATFTGDTIDIEPYLLARSNAASNDTVSATFGLDFTPAPGYAITGEQVAYEIDLDVGTYDLPSTQYLSAEGDYRLAIGGSYSRSDASTGGVSHDTGSTLVDGTTVSVDFLANAFEGIACPAGDDANGCDFGNDDVTFDALVDFSALSITPILTAVPEPDMLALWLGALALAALRRRPRRAA